MSWKRAQIHAESMLSDLGVPAPKKGRRDLRGCKLFLIDDEANEYRTMCFSIAAKLIKRRGADIEVRKPGPGEMPHAKFLRQSSGSQADRRPANQGARRPGSIGSSTRPGRSD